MKWECYKRVSTIEEEEEIKRSDSLPQEEVEKIQCFYRKESIILPLKRTVSAKNFVQKGVMTDTISNAHSKC
jgi:hypothetical protein